MSPSQKIECVCALTRTVRQLALANIRRRHPEAGERELALRLASRSIEPELMVRAFGRPRDRLLMFTEPLIVLARLVRAFTELGVRYVVGGSLEGKLSVRFASAEDTVLHKLAWYRLGNEVSDRQWNDAIAVLNVQAAALDLEYLEHWAHRLGVLDLLQRATQNESGTQNTA
jgi:hypothetical protein